MCDTLGRLTAGSGFFAKNSDRSVNEAQLLEYHPAREGLSGDVACTYISVPQVSRTYGVLLSRPAWMWGAEMGVNECGLCIGNEAVFTRGAYGKTGLTGMDMLRLALERCATAEEALKLLISLLETYGQGGNCGFDHEFYYDNAFLIMDRKALYVLETAGKEWVYRRCDGANISNRLSIGTGGMAYSAGKTINFRKKYTEPVFTTFSGSARRYAQLRAGLPGAGSVRGCMSALRSHDNGVENPFAKGCVSSACMHYGGPVGDNTTASMVVELAADRTVVWSTGTSLPCVSLFKPWLFGTDPVLPVTVPDDPAGKAYWLEAESFRRGLVGRQVPPEFYERRDALESAWIARSATVSREAFPGFSQECLEEERAFYAVWRKYEFPAAVCAPGYLRRWDKANRCLK